MIMKAGFRNSKW